MGALTGDADLALKGAIAGGVTGGVAGASAGEQQSQNHRYNFYPMNINDIIYQGIHTGDVRVELGFAGPNVWTINSYAYIDGAEQKVQTFRFTRTQ